MLDISAVVWRFGVCLLIGFIIQAIVAHVAANGSSSAPDEVLAVGVFEDSAGGTQATCKVNANALVTNVVVIRKNTATDPIGQGFIDFHRHYLDQPAYLPAWTPPMGTGAGVEANAYGWPMRSFRATTAPADSGAAAMTWPRNWVLLYQPLLVGTLMNSAVFSAPGALFFALLLFVRRWRLRRKGRCVRCGYDLSSVPTGACPECGRIDTRPRNRAAA